MLHLITSPVYDIDPTLDPIQGPLSEEQQQQVEAIAARFSLALFGIEIDPLDAAHGFARRAAWVSSRGQRHFCPGYYDCTICCPD